jgi:copper chaperone CopZ
MSHATRTLFAALTVALLIAPASFAATSVTVSGSHLCCGNCYKAAEAAVKSVKGASIKFDKTAKTMTVAAANDATAQKALDALAQAGFCGKTGDSKVTFKAAEVPAGKIKAATVSNVHNCCGKCGKAITEALEKVDGLDKTKVEGKATTFKVTGNFEAKELAKALADAGYSATIKAE